MRHWFTLTTFLLLTLPMWGQNPDSVYTKDGVALARPSVSKNIRPVYRNHFYHSDTLPGAATPVLWVVTPPQLAATMEPFLQWKRQMGFHVDTFWVSVPHCDSIHNLLQRHYDEVLARRRTPDYVLIVGDAEWIAPFPGRHRPSSELTSYYTDLYYGEFTGDFYPEAVVGRLPATDAGQLHAMLDKTMAYEQSAQYAGNHLQRALLVAGKENIDPAPTVTNGQVNYLSRVLESTCPGMDTVCFRNPASEQQLDQIVEHVRQGVGLICYTAHGTIHGWHYPDYTYSIADTLSDTNSTIYINNCCYTNNFASDCMGEHLLRKSPGGAVGVIGATNSTLWEEDYLWSVGARQDYTLSPEPNTAHPGALDRYLFRQQLSMQQQSWTLGDLMHAGNYAVSEAGSVFESYYWEIYNLLGDPTLMPFIGVPEPLVVAATEPVRRGATAMTLVGTPDSYVAVVDSAGLLGSGWTDSTGTAHIALIRGVAVDTVRITASCAGHAPYTAVVTTDQTSQPRLTVAHYEQRGDSLMVVLANVSEDTCFGHAVALQQMGGDSNGFRIVPTVPIMLDTVMPQSRHTVMLPLTVGATGLRPLVLFHIVLADEEEIYSRLQVALPHTAERPQITDIWPLYEGEPARSITYGTPYTMAFVVNNPTDDTTYFLIGVRDSFPTYTFTIAPRRCDTLYVDIVTRNNDGMSYGGHCLPIKLHCGAWQQDTQCCLLLHDVVESFEYGDFSAYPWDNTSSLQPWRIDSEIHYSGHYSVRSGPIGNRQTSDLALSLYLPYSDTLTFYRRTSTEADYDLLLFYVDNVQYDGWSGQNGWSRVRYVLPPGHHRLLWRYRKDESGSHGDDCVWIDNIRLPLAIWNHVYGGRGSADIEEVEQTPFQPRVYPNPASEVVTLAGLPADGRWKAALYDLSGRPVRSLTAGGNNIGNLAPGVYFIVVRTSERPYIFKLLVL